jgi:hypothetical protein
LSESHVSLLFIVLAPHLRRKDTADVDLFRVSLGAWCIGHRLHQQNRRSWVRNSPGCKVFRTLYTHSNAVLGN